VGLALGDIDAVLAEYGHDPLRIVGGDHRLHRLTQV
jgi:hypothetical protein